MARSRNIKPGFFLNDELADIEPLGRLLFIGLWTVADREGRLRDRPRKIKAAILPYDDVDVCMLLERLMHGAFIRRFEIGGEKYIQINNWAKHQSPHHRETESDIPSPKDPQAVDLTEASEKPRKASENTERAALIPDSLNLIPDSLRKDMSGKPDHSAGPTETVFQHWQNRMNHPKAVLDAKRRRLILSRLKDYPPYTLIAAIDGCAKTPFNMGDNPDGRVYDSIELILRDSKHIDDFVRNNEAPPQPRTDNGQGSFEAWQAMLRAKSG